MFVVTIAALPIERRLPFGCDYLEIPAQNHASFMPLARTQTACAILWRFAVASASRSLRVRPPLPTHAASWAVSPPATVT
jgi:hypothetical protein